MGKLKQFLIETTEALPPGWRKDGPKLLGIMAVSTAVLSEAGAIARTAPNWGKYDLAAAMIGYAYAIRGMVRSGFDLPNSRALPDISDIDDQTISVLDDPYAQETE